MNLDFADVSTTLRNGGVALISTGQASGDGRVSKAIKEATTSPLLQDNDIHSSKHLLFELCFSESNPVSMSEIAELNDFVKSLNADIQVIWGAMVDNSLGDDVKLIMLASGFDMDHESGKIFAQSPYAPDPEMEIIKADEDAIEIGSSETIVKEEPEIVNDTTPVAEEPKEEEPVNVALVAEPEQESEVEDKPVAEEPVKTIETVKPSEPVKEEVESKVEEPEVVTTVVEQAPITPAPAKSVMEGIDNIAAFYGEEMANQMRLDVARKAYYVLDNDDLTNEELIAEIEKLPAYNRSVEELGELKDKFKK